MKEFFGSRLGRLFSVLFVVIIATFFHRWEALAGVPIVFGMADYSAVPGSPDFVATGDIPKVFSLLANKQFFDGALVMNICNHNWEEEIKSFGQEVSIPNDPDTHVYDLPRGGKVTWEEPSKAATIFKVNRRKVFSFRQDKMNLAQMQSKNFIERLTDKSWKEMDETISQDFLLDIPDQADVANQGAGAGLQTGLYNLGIAGAPVQISKSNFPDFLHMLHAVFDERKIPANQRKLTLPAIFCMLLKISDLKDKSMTGEQDSIRRKATERLGNVEGWEIYRSNMYTPITDVAAGSKICFKILFNHMEGISYAGQLQDAEIHEKFEDVFAKGVKAENIFDWVANEPKYVGKLYATPILNL